MIVARLKLFLAAVMLTSLLLKPPAATAADPFPGNPPIVPRWALEHWVWEDNTNTRASTENLVQGYLDHQIPVGAVIIDSPWETFYNTFDWDTSRFPDPQGMIDGFHTQGVRVILWITGFVNTDSPDYNYVKSQGYAINNGQAFDWWKGRGVHIDFTNPNARAWWHGQMDEALNLGADGWKVDMSADQVPNPVTTSLGSIARSEFKKYYYADFFDHSTGRSPQQITMARAYSSHQGGIGGSISKVTVGWNGDYDGDFAGLDKQKNDMYESALQGYGAPGIEVGGYWHVNPTRNSLIRYAQLGALTPLMENGGGNGGETEHLPWHWDAQTVDIYRYFATLHSELAPYIFSYSVESNQTGTSILRSVDKAKSHHKLGEEVFVSVIQTDVTSKTVDFPPGSKWIDYWDEAVVYEGGTSLTYSAPLDRYPIFLKAGAVIPLDVENGVTGHGDQTSAGKVTLLVYPYGQSGLTYHHPTGAGIDYTDARIDVNEQAGTITVDGTSPVAYRLRVKSFTSPTSVGGADSWWYDPAAKVVVIDKQGQDFTLQIAGLRGYSGPTSQGLIANLAVNDGANAAAWSTRANLQPGDLQYGDRSYTISAIGAGLAGSDWIRTANASKAYTGSTLATFRVTAEADVFVAHNDRIPTTPSWLSSANGWLDTGQDLTNSEPRAFSLFKQHFTAGATVTLGNNGNTTEGMYTVIVKAAGAAPPSPTPTPTATASPTPTTTTPAPPPACGGLVQEAEAGALSGAFSVGSDGAASGGKFLHVPNGTGSILQVAGNPHQASFCFSVSTAGTYRLKGGVYAANAEDDSLFVTVDGSPAGGYLWDIYKNTQYSADYLNHRGVGDPVEIDLSAGNHTVVVYLREDGARLDRLELESSAGPPAATPTSPAATPTPPPPFDRIFSDGFESGNFSAWSANTTDGGDLMVSSSAALAGSYGLQANVDDSNAIYMTDSSPNAEKRYRARFYLDPNSLSMSNGNAHDLFNGYSGSATQVLRVQFRRYSSSYQLRVLLLNDGTGWKASNWFAVSDSPHSVELDWQAASQSGANDGGLTFWIDGSQKVNLTGVDNDTRRIDQVRWGVMGGIESSTRGACYFDAFDSRRQSNIGP